MGSNKLGGSTIFGGQTILGVKLFGGQNLWGSNFFGVQFCGGLNFVGGSTFLGVKMLWGSNIWVGQHFLTPLQISAGVDGGLRGGSSVRRPGSEEPHRRQRKFCVPFYVFLDNLRQSYIINKS